MDNNLKELKQNCFNALRCLFITAEEQVAEDVNWKVRGYVEALEQKIEDKEEEIRVLNSINNSFLEQGIRDLGVKCPVCAAAMEKQGENDWVCAKCRVHYNLVFGVWFEGKNVKLKVN